jgi:hypothetical protein
VLEKARTSWRVSQGSGTRLYSMARLNGAFLCQQTPPLALKRSTFLGGSIGFGSSFDLFHLMEPKTQGLAENPANFHNLFDKTTEQT